VVEVERPDRQKTRVEKTCIVCSSLVLALRGGNFWAACHRNSFLLSYHVKNSCRVAH